MTTIITPSNAQGASDGSAGWAVAVLILLVVLGVGAYFWTHHRGAASDAGAGTNINVTLPNTSGGNSNPTP